VLIVCRLIGANTIRRNAMELDVSDPKNLGWYVYGIGAVDAAGQKVIPNPSTRLHYFTEFDTSIFRPSARTR
jgi:hypothetical protein